MALIQCPNCKRDINDSSLYCSFCGERILPEKNINGGHIIQCQNCKKEIPTGSQYCSFCGHKIVSDNPHVIATKTEKRILPQCPNCKRDVAYTSEKCPYCGHKLIPQKPPEESRLITCPNCGHDIVRTSEKCGYCGFQLKTTKYIKGEEDEGKSKFEEFQEGCAGCNKGLFQFGCGLTLLMALLGLLLFILGII